jgi:hypothetical protein
MRLALCYNVWADWGFLANTLEIMRPLADGVIIVGSQTSNFGEVYPIPIEWETPDLYVVEPDLNRGAMWNETRKRNHALQLARSQGYTHFLTIDADEAYNRDDFLRAKERFKNEGLSGLVCPTRVYFGSTDLTIGFDRTLVPFIHKLIPSVRHEFNKRYPFAWDSKGIRIDPTRSLDINCGVEYTEDVVCEHYSWCRGDYERKIRNSTARANLERSTILTDLRQAKEGYFCQFYQKTLQRSTVNLLR